MASRTLKTCPLSGKTPYLSRPTTPKPETASELAKSSLVRMTGAVDRVLGADVVVIFSIQD